MRWGIGVGDLYDRSVATYNPIQTLGGFDSDDHLKARTVGASQTVIVHNGKLLLGRWQGIYFCEFDGHRERTCYMKIFGYNLVCLIQKGWANIEWEEAINE